MPNGDQITQPKKKLSGNQKALIGLGVLVVAGIGGFLIFRASRRKPQQFQNIVPPETTSTGVASSSLPIGTFPLNRDDTNQKVLLIQTAIIENGGLPTSIVNQAGGADGILGPGTQQALSLLGISLPVTEEVFNRFLSKVSADMRASSGKPTATTPSAIEKKIASEMFRHMVGFGTREEELFQEAKKVLNQQMWENVKAAFKTLTNGKNLIEELKSELDSSELFQFTSILKENKVTLQGLGQILEQRKIKPLTQKILKVKESNAQVINENGRTLPVRPGLILGRKIALDAENNLVSILTADNGVIFAPASAVEPAKGITALPKP